MENLRITLLQTELYWENRTANLSMLEEKIWRIGQPTDVIVLPEMFTTGFTMNAAPLAEPMNLHTFKWLKQIAAQTGALLLGSYIVAESGHFYNRLLWVEPGGNCFTYDKRHLFRMAGEHLTYTAGTKRLTGQWKSWRICPLICYDLRFPVWCRNRYHASQQHLEYDALIVVANWPAARIEAWDALLKARAIENLCYAAGVNRVGTDGNGIAYNGHSAVYGPKGEVLAFEERNDTAITVVLDGPALMAYREKFPAWQDADNFDIHI